MLHHKSAGRFFRQHLAIRFETMRQSQAILERVKWICLAALGTALGTA